MQTKQLNIVLLSLILLGGVSGMLQEGCTTNPSESQIPNRPPETSLWTDTIGRVLTSQVTLHWWGDDPDGFLLGYFVTVDGEHWTFTTSNDSTIVVDIGTKNIDTSKIQVAAVDKQGNGVWDASVIIDGQDIGGEPFVDADSNGTYTPGEKFIDCGLIDQTPATLSVVIKNSPPSVAFEVNTSIPSSTLPVVSILFNGTDPDGNSTIKNYYIALNDTSASAWQILPNTVSLVTLVGDLSDTSATVVPMALKSGTNAEDLGISVQGLQLNHTNVLYLYCTDLTGSRSPVIRMPDSTKTWYVQKPVGRKKLLLIDDFGTGSPNPTQVYKSALSQTMNSSDVSYSDFDVLNLYTGDISPSLSKPMLSQTMIQYPIVLWYVRTGDVEHLRYAQETVPGYIQNGGKVVFTSGFENFVTNGSLPLNFLPIDTLVTGYRINDSTSHPGYISRVYKDSKILPTDSVSSSPYPLLVYDRTAIFGTYAFEPGPTDSVLYKLDLPNPSNSQELWVGHPSVGVISNNRSLVFFSMPLHLMNTVDSKDGRSRLTKLFERIFRGEFGE